MKLNTHVGVKPDYKTIKGNKDIKVKENIKKFSAYFIVLC